MLILMVKDAAQRHVSLVAIEAALVRYKSIHRTSRTPAIGLWSVHNVLVLISCCDAILGANF